MSEVVLALDCGTHAVRATAFDVHTGVGVACASVDIALLFPRPGWVEVDPEVLASASASAVRRGVEWAVANGHDILALGLANMRETAFAWRRSSGAPLRCGVMWMSQQSQPVVDRWHAEGLGPMIRQRTGLDNDAFFFGSKVAWMLENDPSVRAAADAGDLAVGTVDAWLLHRLTGGRSHRTDVANGSRTQLMNLATGSWDDELCRALGVPMESLPALTPTMADFGVTDPRVCGAAIPVTGMIADQQASLLGHGCEDVGAAKTTFGTSGVVSVNLGAEVVLRDGLVTSVAWGQEGGPLSFQIEGSAFHSGYTMLWLDERLSPSAVHHETASELPAAGRVYLLPAFSSLGAPRWPRGRGASVVGLGMDTQTHDIRRAAVEAMAFQAYDLFAALGDVRVPTLEMNVDGGGATNDYLCQLLADLLDLEVVRPDCRELTSVGAAKAALRGLGRRVEPWFGQDRAAATRFAPSGSTYAADGYEHWVDLVERILR